jgi:branched-chain amino acid transport system permease protein
VAAGTQQKRLSLPSWWTDGSTGVLTAALMVLFMVLWDVTHSIDPVIVMIEGVALGSLYGVVALGYTMVYGIIELINFAHGDVFAVGAFVSLLLMEKMDSQMADQNLTYDPGSHPFNILGLHMNVDVVWLTVWTLLLSVIVAAAVCGILGVLIERVAYRPLRNAPRLAPLITAIGVSFIIENALFQWRGGVPLSYPQIMPASRYSDVGPIHLTNPISNVQIFVIISALVLMVLLDRFVNQTKLGKAMRAVAQDREAALMMGINVNRMIALTFFVGSALAGAGAVIYGVDLESIGNNMGFSLGLFAFTAAVLGGIGNIRGAMLGGVLIGIIKRFVDYLGQGRGTEWADVVVFLILIGVLVFRPSGLLGSQVPDKV